MEDFEHCSYNYSDHTKEVFSMDDGIDVIFFGILSLSAGHCTCMYL